MNNLRLGVNIDHVATTPNARIWAYIVGAPLLMLTWDLFGDKPLSFLLRSPRYELGFWLFFILIPALLSVALSCALLLWRSATRGAAAPVILSITLLEPFMLLPVFVLASCLFVGACL